MEGKEEVREEAREVREEVGGEEAEAEEVRKMMVVVDVQEIKMEEEVRNIKLTNIFSNLK
jgi:hypothetical protein